MIDTEAQSDLELIAYSLSVAEFLKDCPPEPLDLMPPNARAYLFFSQYAPYTWRLRNGKGDLLERSDVQSDDRRHILSNAEQCHGAGIADGSVFVVNYHWRELLKTGTYMDAHDPNQQAIFPHEYTSAVRDGVTVEVVDATGDDQLICKAARVSTLGAASIDTEESAGLINFLLKNRHGSPFEHGFMTFRITAPIFVWREFMRHRIGFSYNEQSGRYMELEAMSYLPPRDRKLVQVGKAGAYTFEPGTDEQYELVVENLSRAYDAAWSAYHKMLDAGIAKEVARFCLPVATYSTAYVSCNPRSLMAFLSLRTNRPNAKFISTPQKEINDVADQMETYFQDLWPLTHAAFDNNGRVSP